MSYYITINAVHLQEYPQEHANRSQLCPSNNILCKNLPQKYFYNKFHLK
jgi:hypothetical protein